MKKGFTLAEVLITLGIIGIVAAMTLPTVINDSRERETVAKVKKFYSVMNQALLMAISKHGYVDDWGFCEQNNAECAAQFVRYLKPELKILRDCADATDCIINGSYKHLKGTAFQSVYGTNPMYYKIILFDGSYLWIRHNSSSICQNTDAGTDNVCGLLWHDINGPKNPNQLGVDTFVFFIMNNRIIPHSNDDCYKEEKGWGCSGFVLQHDNLKYPQRKN